MTATFDPFSNPVDFVTIAGQRTPGIAEILDADKMRRLIERRGFALSGATVRDGGAMLVHFKIRLTFTTSADFEAWDAFRPLLARPPGRAGGSPRNALDVEHPILALADIRSVIPEKVGQPVPTDAGAWTIELGFCEFRNPQPQLDPIDGSDAVATPGNGTPEQIIEARTRELHDLAAVDSFAGAP